MSLVKCWKCGATGEDLDEFTSPYTGLCVECTYNKGKRGIMEFDEIVANANQVSEEHRIAMRPTSVSSIGVWCKTINQWAERKGWNKDLTIGDQIANCHSEISEAWEEWRTGHLEQEVYYNYDLCTCGVPVDHVSTLQLHAPGCHATKPEGFPIELADCVIRIMHTFGYYGIDLEGMIKLKMGYNETREMRHGGKKA